MPTAAMRGQSALDGFDPNSNSPIDVVVVQPDGKVLIGGGFSTLSPNGGPAVTRHGIARLNPDGTLDTAFDPNAFGHVDSIAIQADGKILVGGLFIAVGGQPRNRIARLDPTTGLADSFDPNANNEVNAIAIQADGKILVCGGFNGANSIGGQTRNRIARLDATTGLADSFDPNADNTINAIAVQPDANILVGGAFSTIGGQPRNRIARLDGTTGLADSFNPNASDNVFSIALQADGRVLAGGAFNGTNSIGGQTRNFIARLDAITGLADSFDPNVGGFDIYSIVVQADGKILAGGSFTSIGGQTRHNIARLDASTGLADSFNPSTSSTVASIAVQADGKILTGGLFSSASGQPRNFIARLEADGRLDQTLNLNAIGSLILATAVQPDGKMLIGGSFTTVLGLWRNNIARLNTDGTLDAAFNPSANDVVQAIAVQADGKILAGGQFHGINSIGGQTRNFIARLDATTGLADSFDPNANSFVDSIVVDAEGRILVGGAFNGANSVGGQNRNRIARLDSTTGLADSFNPSANDYVYSIVLQADGKILVGGAFNGANSIGGQARNRIARLDATTGLADSFNPNANGTVISIALQADGKVLVGGGFNGANSIGGQARNRIARLDGTTGLADSLDPNANGFAISIAVHADGRILAGGAFTNIGGQSRNRIARLDPTTGLADSFDPNASNDVYSVAVQADGKVLAGGSFTTMNGQPRALFARLSNSSAAMQRLDVTQAAITWTLGGSSPQFVRVTFDYSTDNVNYTFLGNGGATGGNWTLTGLNLPTGLNFYIRARGHYPSAADDGSESIIESVRNSFLAGPAATPTPTVTTTPSPTPPSPTPTLTPTATPPISTPSPTPTATPTATSTATPTPGCDDTWTATNTANAPIARNNHTAIWTGSEMIVWGGRDATNHYLNSGGRYNPATNSWTATSTTNAPTLRGSHMAVWTGSEMIVWGGGDSSGYLNTGGRYNPTTDTWTAMSMTNAPSARYLHTMFWTGSEIIVWGGYDGGYLGTGGRYNPDTDSWTATSTNSAPTARCLHTAVWTGSEMIVWGGYFYDGSDHWLNSGGKYDPNSDSWTAATSNINAPTSRVRHTAVWTGSEMIVWGGDNATIGYFNTGGRYNPGTDSWTVTSMTSAPTAREFHTALWTGGEMIVWGGKSGSFDALNTGGRYRPGTDSWQATRTIGAPGVRAYHTGIWTGGEMIVWGGYTGTTFLNTGGRYCAQPTLSISGTVSYCSNPNAGPVPNVTLTLAGDTTASMLSDGSGNYLFSSLAAGGSYAVTPMKAALTPGAAGIDTVDVLAAQRHFLILGMPLSGCRLMAADVNGNSSIDTVDVIAIQRFFLGFSSGIANVGQYKFTPANRSYFGIVTDQTGQNYDTLVFGDVASTFVERLDGPPRDATGDGENLAEQR